MSFPRSPVPDRRPEPWLRGPLEGVPPFVMPVFFSFAQVREDLVRHTAGLGEAQVWRKVGMASLGFELKHMAGSVDRLTTYLMGGQLSSQQLAFLQDEANGSDPLAELLRQLDEALKHCQQHLLTLSPAALFEARSVGRQALPTTVLGLLVHLAEHTQRHLGQAVTLCQVLKLS